VTVFSADDNKVKKKPLLEILCDKRTYRVLPYILWLLPESETSLLSEIATE
jgi:hypothetical protein